MSERNLDKVEIGRLEIDEQVAIIQRRIAEPLKKERGYTELSPEKKAKVDKILDSIAEMRFKDRSALVEVTASLLQNVAPDLSPYIEMAARRAASAVERKKGVLVIYTGGTIGSAPKDPNDPDSPQIVKPWADLKNAAPQLGALGYPIDAVAFTNPLDSCNVGPQHWKTMVSIITEHYAEYEGFVILHGTDSMVYTASALSFMLLDLGKPVVITGSQVAGIVNPRNDAHQNIITALILANPKANNLPVIPEVIIVFGNIILRGNRSKKMNVIGYQGFNTPNYPNMGVAGEVISVEHKHIRKVPETDLQVLDAMDTNVIVVEVFPGMQHSKILENILRDDTLKGVVLKSYGAGNIPTDPPFLNLFKKFIDGGGIVVNVTSVPEGEVVMGLYETSQVLIDRGIIGGFDITPEAALCKLMVLLGNYSEDLPEVRRLMQQSIAGEQRLSLETTTFTGAGAVKAGEAAVSLPKSPLSSVFEAERIQKAMLRFKNAKFSSGAETYGTINIYLIESDSAAPELLTGFRRAGVTQALVQDAEVGESMTFDVTRFKDRLVAKATTGRVKTTQRISFAVEVKGTEVSFSWDGAELNIYTTD